MAFLTPPREARAQGDSTLTPKAASGNLPFSPSVTSLARLAIESGCELHRNRSIGGNLSHQVYLTRAVVAGDAAGVDLRRQATGLRRWQAAWTQGPQYCHRSRRWKTSQGS